MALSFSSVRFCSLPLLLFCALATKAQYQPTNFKFDFGADKPSEGYTPIWPDQVFLNKVGYGFEPGSAAKVITRNADKKLTGSFITGNQPFYFSVNVPEGNYKVTVTLGDVEGKSTTTIRAESRRLMLEKIQTDSGKTTKYTFIVNVRKPLISTGGSVSLKPREEGKYDWDDKLTLEFNDARPCINAVEIEKVDDQITVYLAGNSTVVDQDAEPWASWGQMITRFFKPGVAISNHAESGLTLGSFLGSHRLDKVMSTIKPGDYLFIEFGHNDQKEKGANDGAWKSYTERLKTYVTRTREKGAIPVIVTSASRRSFNDSAKTINTLGDFPAAAKKVAKDLNVPLIDLNAMSTQLYDALGVEPSKKAFVFYPAGTWPGQKEELHDNTHFNSYGAYQLAKCIVQGIKANKLKLKKYLVKMADYNPAQPDAVDTFSLPISVKSSNVKPDGN